jgi:nitroimidazol reductase NimA-like FMN-containing flavoprotein (pyridoxamine 5'-phosphate oxidase superfamily)
MTPTTPPSGRGETETNRTGSERAGIAEGARGMRSGDLARRVTHRRTELGLSSEELARRAGIDAWFLAYFEQSADTSLSGGALFRLAVALDTTPFALEGGQIDRPPGPGRAGPHPVLESLTPAQCEQHLAAGGVGRIVLSTGSGPVAFPVNFVFAHGSVIFRTSDAMVATITGVVAFEVDHVDEAMSEGWSVLVRGHARLIEGAELRLVAARLDVEPWAGGARLNVVSIAPFEITGRVIVQRRSLGRA